MLAQTSLRHLVWLSGHGLAAGPTTSGKEKAGRGFAGCALSPRDHILQEDGGGGTGSSLFPSSLLSTTAHSLVRRWAVTHLGKGDLRPSQSDSKASEDNLAFMSRTSSSRHNQVRVSPAFKTRRQSFPSEGPSQLHGLEFTCVSGLPRLPSGTQPVYAAAESNPKRKPESQRPV